MKIIILQVRVTDGKLFSVSTAYAGKNHFYSANSELPMAALTHLAEQAANWGYRLHFEVLP